MKGRPPKLTKDQVAIIRAGGWADKDLTVMFNTSTVTLWKVRAKRKPYDYDVDLVPVHPH